MLVNVIHRFLVSLLVGCLVCVGTVTAQDDAAKAVIDSLHNQLFAVASDSAFKRLSIANYASRFAEIKKESLVITDVRPATGKRLQVDSRLKTGEHDLILSYTLKQDSDNNWLIVNVIADGVSDLALRRAEYSQVFKSKGFDGLLARINEQIAELQ